MKPFWTTKNTIHLCAMFALWSLLTIPALGQQSDNDIVTWGVEILEDGTAAVYFDSGSLSQTIVVPSTIEKDGSTYTVTTIRTNAFYNNVDLSGISIPNTVTNIDNKAFYGCTKLSELKLSDSIRRIGEEAFRGCSGLSSVVLPANLEYIGDGAFRDCDSVSFKTPDTDIFIPSSVTYIGAYAYYNCDSLQGKLILPDGLEAVGAHAFGNCDGITSLVIPNSMTHLGDSAFAGCTSLANVSGGQGLVEIGGGAFKGCSSLTQWPPVTPKPPVLVLDLAGLPNLENIGDEAFQSCTALETATIGDSVTNIGANAFAYCSGLWSITIGQGVITIGEGAFRETGLKRLHVPDSVISMGAAVCSNCPSLTGVHLSGNLEYLGNNGFRNCGVLMYIDIPDSLKDIEYQTFYGCTGLLDINIGNSITNIGPEACRSCASLTNMVISGKVKTVDKRAFFECMQLRDVYLGKTVENIGYEAFAFCPALMNITVDVRNTHFTSIDGILYDTKPQMSLVTMPNGRKGEFTVPSYVAYIGPYAFSYCTYLTGVKLPSKLKAIREGAFNECINLLKMDVPDSVTEIGMYSFRHCVALKSVSTGDGVTELVDQLFSGCVALTDAVVGKSVVYIGVQCFNHCIKLSNLTLPDGLQEIDDRGFYDCMNLKTFRIPPAVERLGAYSLGHCYGLTTVTIPASVKEVGDYAFYQCRDMQSIYFEGDAPATETYSFVLQDAICTAYVRPGSTGWGVPIPGTWGYIPIDYYGEIMGEGSASVSGVMVSEEATNAVAISKDATYYLDMQPVSLTSKGLIALGEVADPAIGRDGTVRLPHVISVKEPDEGAQLPGVTEVRGTDGETVAAEVVFTPDSGDVQILTTKDGQPEEGVTVWIDNAVEPLGVTPLTVTNLAASRHILLLQKDGFLRPRPVNFTVTAGSVLTIEIPMTTDDQQAMEMNVKSSLPGVDIYVDFLPVGEVTPKVVGGMDPASYSGEGWSSTCHSILLRHELLTPYAPRMVPEWEIDPETGDPIIPEDPEVITIAAPNDFLDSDGDGMTNIYEVENGLNPFVSDDNVLVGHASNGETITIQARKESGGLIFTAMEGGEEAGTLDAYLLGEISGSVGSVVKSGLYLMMKRALVGEESEQVFAYPCVVEIYSPVTIRVTWNTPEEEGSFFMIGLCDSADKAELEEQSAE